MFNHNQAVRDIEAKQRWSTKRGTAHQQRNKQRHKNNKKKNDRQGEVEENTDLRLNTHVQYVLFEWHLAKKE